MYHFALNRIERNRTLSLFAVLMSFNVMASPAWAAESNEDPLRGEATAPANMASLGSSVGGAFFVDKQLVEMADSLKIELQGTIKCTTRS